MTGPIAAEVDRLAGDLAAALPAIPVTTDQQQLRGLLADHGAVLMVAAPEVTGRTVGGCWRLTIPVHLVGRSSATVADLAPILSVLPAVLDAAQTATAEPGAVRLGTTDLPTYTTLVQAMTTTT